MYDRGTAEGWVTAPSGSRNQSERATSRAKEEVPNAASADRAPFIGFKPVHGIDNIRNRSVCSAGRSDTPAYIVRLCYRSRKDGHRRQFWNVQLDMETSLYVDFYVSINS